MAKSLVLLVPAVQKQHGVAMGSCTGNLEAGLSCGPLVSEVLGCLWGFFPRKSACSQFA